MMLSINEYVFKFLLLSWILLLMTDNNSSVNGQQQQIVKSYGIAFYHGNTSLPESTCINSFNMIKNSIYPLYLEESFNDSMFNNSIRNKIKSMSESRGIQIRKLLRSSSTKQVHHDQIIQNEQERILSSERKLSVQTWCYAQCSSYTRLWLITRGCGDECGLRRRLDESIITSSEIEKETIVQDEDNNGRELQLSSGVRGNIAKILQGPGDTVGSQFYSLVNATLVSTDVCKPILMNMSYAIWPIYMIL